MDRSFGEKLGDRIKTPGTRTWAKRVLEAWTKEVFCDLFAVRNLGPAFSIALIDFLSLLGLMGEDVEGKFENLPSGHVSLMARLAGKTEPEYFFEFQETVIPAFVEAFLTIVPLIHELAVDLTTHSEAAAADFAQHAERIDECLLHGVVPSSLLAEDKPSSPNPVSMINAAYCFLLTSLPKLIETLEGQRADNLQQRMNWAEKLEAWTVKGVEDSQLLAARGNSEHR
ncbi:MAG TPA: hypothetical protein VMQ86_11350 [Bryobacteraceae bacterium]|jgi:hypothetical protein|nr:hypothetical protein [Bryobacteraceae bacterium]